MASPNGPTYLKGIVLRTKLETTGKIKREKRLEQRRSSSQCQELKQRRICLPYIIPKSYPYRVTACLMLFLNEM
jgi:hypothetical protein